MAGEVVVSSTTDSQAAVDAAAHAYGEQPGEEKVEQPEPSEKAKEKPEDETEAESETAKPESEEEEEEELAEPASKGRRRLLRRVSTLTGRNFRLQEQLDELQARLKQADGGPKTPAPAAGPPPKPTQDQFKDYESFVEALADWRIDERDRLKAQQAHEAYVQQIYTEYNQQVDDARETHQDFDEVVGQAAQVPMVAINMMYELDNGAEVAYFLGKHPEVREQMLEWNTPGTKGGIRKIVVELDRISTQLSGKSSSNGTSPKPRVAAPPAPIKPVGATSRSTANPGEMNMRDYKKWYAENFPNSR
jgi:hypothetical protein